MIKNSTLKKAGTYAILLAVGIGLITILGFATKGFTEKDPENWVLQERNEDNLLDLTRSEDEPIIDGTGLTITLKKDGSVVVDGKSGATEPTTLELGTVTLKPGTYTFTSDCKKVGLYSMYLKLQLGDTFVTADFNGYDNIVIDEETTATVVLVVCEDVEFNNATLYPAIWEGNEAADFYE